MRLVSKWSLGCREEAGVHTSKQLKCDLIPSLMWWVTNVLDRIIYLRTIIKKLGVQSTLFCVQRTSRQFLCLQTTQKTYKYAALDAVGTAGKCRVRWLNIGETKQFYHRFYFNYIKDINFHNFFIAKVTKPDFPRLLRSWKTLWHAISKSFQDFPKRVRTL
jgi:hypothetical protein